MATRQLVADSARVIYSGAAHNRFRREAAGMRQDIDVLKNRIRSIPPGAEERFKVRVTGKQVNDVDTGAPQTIRICKYSWVRIECDQYGQWTVNADHPSSTVGGDPFALAALHEDELYRVTEKHTGLIIPTVAANQPITDLTYTHHKTEADDLPPHPMLLGLPLPEFFAVKVTKVSGSEGTKTTPATWKYTMRDLDGVVLADSDQVPKQMTPEFPRPPIGKMIAPPANTIGMARWDLLTMTLKLHNAQEVRNPKACP